MSAAIPKVLSEKVLIITTFYGHYFELDESPPALRLTECNNTAQVNNAQS